MPAASSTSSLSSSLDSAGSSILPAAPPSNSSQSDIVTYDHKVRQSPSPAPGLISIPSPTVILGAPRSSSLVNHAMGHVVSRPAPATPPPSQSQAPTSPSKATSRLKRVFGGGRRKKSDDVTQEGPLDLPPVPPLKVKVKGKQREASPLGGRAGTSRHAVAILDATVRSLSSFALLRWKACCRQSSRLLQA
ncbi:hypothetical protein EWM64_g4017 [Hericium alpestre]|uniref:Uncharacterized protein n=1 Tax=Hericium alpestre TaxID=135208 RepID=A0A4Z0A0Z0_9AGAM|nr:hypothetical protein EWM64_g4017 [Hericium alpestre]